MCSEVDITCIGIEFKWSSGRGFEEWPGSAAGLQLERALFGPYRGSHKFLNLRYEPDKRDESYLAKDVGAENTLCKSGILGISASAQLAS